MNKQQLQNLKKYIENYIAGYLKISNDIQNLQFSDDNYLNHFENFTEEQLLYTDRGASYHLYELEKQLTQIIERLKKQLTEVNELLWQIHCKELQDIMEPCF
jgi:hypothetical protein